MTVQNIDPVRIYNSAQTRLLVWRGVRRKSQKISTALDQYFLSYVKITTGGGQIDPPPLAGIGLKIKKVEI